MLIADDEEIKEVAAGDAMDGYAEEMRYFVDCLEHQGKLDKYLPESALESVRLCYKHLKT